LYKHVLQKLKVKRNWLLCMSTWYICIN